VDPTKQWIGGEVLWILLTNGPENVCDMKCMIDGTFRTYHQFITWDVTPLGTFYHGFFRHLGHIRLERFITLMFCAGGRFAIASLFYQNPRDVKIRAQITQATHLLKNELQTEQVLQRKY
jgi:hypothetical protein